MWTILVFKKNILLKSNSLQVFRQWYRCYKVRHWCGVQGRHPASLSAQQDARSSGEKFWEWGDLSIIYLHQREIIFSTGQGVYITGWGAVRFRGPTSNILLQGLIQVSPQSSCKEKFSQFTNGNIRTSQLLYKTLTDHWSNSNCHNILWQQSSSTRRIMTSTLNNIEIIYLNFAGELIK